MNHDLENFMSSMANRNYDIAKERLLDLMSAKKRWRRTIVAEDIPYGFLKELMGFVQYKEEQKRKFYD